MVIMIQQHTPLLLLDGADDIVMNEIQLSCLGVFVHNAMRCQLSLHDLSAATFISEGFASFGPSLRFDSMFV